MPGLDEMWSAAQRRSSAPSISGSSAPRVSGSLGAATGARAVPGDGDPGPQRQFHRRRPDARPRRRKLGPGHAPRRRRPAARRQQQPRHDGGPLYGSLPRPVPRRTSSQTSNGGDPFTEAGFTGWFDLDHGNDVISLGGRLGGVGRPVRADRDAVAASRRRADRWPVDLCQNTGDAAVVYVPRVGAGHRRDADERATTAAVLLDPDGALVSMAVGLGKRDGVAAAQRRPARRSRRRLYHVHGVPADPGRAVLRLVARRSVPARRGGAAPRPAAGPESPAR